MSGLKTDDFLLQDVHGETHFFEGRERVVILARTVEDGHRWVRDQGLSPWGRRWLYIGRSSNALPGAQFHGVVIIPGSPFERMHRLWLERAEAKLPWPVRWLEGAA